MGECFENQFFLLVLAGEEQRHLVHNAFNVLVNEGFLRNRQGVQTLEVVQKFHEIINEPIRRATMAKSDLNSFCPPGKFTLDYQAVITLVYEDSRTNNEYYHAVRVSIFCVKVRSICRFETYKSLKRIFKNLRV